MMKGWLEIIFANDRPTASVPLVFISVFFVSMLQLLAHLLMRANLISVGILANEFIAIAGVPLVLIAVLRLDWATLVPFKRISGSVVALVILATIGADIAIDYLTAVSDAFLPLPDHVADAFRKLMAVDSKTGFIWKLFLLCVVPGFCEELFFRGFCQTSLAARWGNTKAIVVTAVIFAVVHSNPWYVHLFFALGLVLGWIYVATGSLWAPIICHVLNNAWAFTSHTIGFEFPLSEGFGWVDTILFVCGVLIFFSAMNLMSHEKSIKLN